MRFNTKLLLLSTLIFLSACTSRSFLSLSKTDTAKLKTTLEALKESTLIIRLYTNNGKLKALKRTGNKKAISDYQKDRLAYMTTMRKAWTTHYDFSRILFMPDSLYKDFSKGAETTVFLNKNFQLDPSIEMKTDDYFILGRGERDYAFLWLDSNEQLLQPQPPVNFDKLTPWEMIKGTEEFLDYRIKDLNNYFYNLLIPKKND